MNQKLPTQESLAATIDVLTAMGATILDVDDHIVVTFAPIKRRPRPSSPAAIWNDVDAEIRSHRARAGS